MTPRAERTGTPARELLGDLTVTIASGARVATARLHAEAGGPVQIRVDDAALLWREVSRRPVRATARRLAELAPLEVRDGGGRRLMRSYRRGRRIRTRWTVAGLRTLGAAGWTALRRR